MQFLAIEDYKVKNGLSPVIMNDVFRFGKNLAMNLEVVFIFKEQIYKLHVWVTNLLRH